MKHMKRIIIFFFIFCFIFIVKSNFDSTKKIEQSQAVPNYRVEYSCTNNDMYNLLKENLFMGKRVINLKKYSDHKSSEKVFSTIEKVLEENPEILYYEGGKYYSNGILIPKYAKSKDEKLLHQKILLDAKEKIIKEVIKPDMSDFEKEKAIHDYIINTSKYDSRVYTDNEIPKESYTAYGVLVEGIGVCEGYAKAMKLLLDDVGVECHIVSGKSMGMNHAWNMVKLGEDYYHVDATWDDPLLSDGKQILVYNYFNLNDQEISKNHSWNKSKYPKCNAIKYNYYNYYNFIVKDLRELYQKIDEALTKGIKVLEVKILDSNVDKYDIPEIVNKLVVERHYSYSGLSYSYNINEDLNIIRIEFEYE